MNEKIKDGGPAFPLPEIYDDRRGETIQYASEGMSLRDYFAAKAMQVYIASFVGIDAYALEESRNDTARRCYRMADAMVRAREGLE